MNQRWTITIVAAVVLAAAAFAAIVKHKPSMETKVSAADTASVKEMLDEAVKNEADGDKVKARDTYARVVADHPDYDKIEDVQDRLGALSIAIITSNAKTPQTAEHEIVSGDSLGKLARQYNTTTELIKKSNNLKSDVIRVGQKLRIWTAPFNLLVDKSQNILILKSSDEVVKVFTVSTGTNNSTPVGQFKITSKLVDPVWFKSGAIIPPESKENVLGSRWMGFDIAGYGIHGTVEPDKIGQQATAGCVRMLNKEVEELYTIIPVGTIVTIVD